MSKLPLQIEIHADGKLLETRHVAQGVFKIGRLASSHLNLDDAAIARMHAVIEVSDGDVRLVDLGSATGTRLNGARVDKHASLRPGDIIELGSYTLVVRYEYAAMAQRPAIAAGAGTAVPVAHARAETPTAHRPALGELADVERDDGTAVAEVITSYRDTVLDVQHVGATKTRRRVAPWLVAAGALMTVAGAGLLANDVMQDWDGYREAVASAQLEGRPEPAEPGLGLGALGVGLAFLGLVPMMMGMTRRETEVVGDYTIGEASDASFAMSCDAFAGSSFPLVRTIDGTQHLSFSDAMEGHIDFGGARHRLADLVADGRAHRTAQGHRLAIPMGARAQLSVGAITFHVNAVAPGKVIAGRTEVDRPFWAYSGSSLAVIGGLLVLTQLIPDDAMQMSMDDSEIDNRFVGYIEQPDEPEEITPEEEQLEEVAEEAGGQGQRASEPEGKAGNPKEKAANRAYALRKRPGMPPSLDRNFSMDASARKAGILGMMEESSSSFLADANGTFASGHNDEDVWGNINGAEIGSAYGMAGRGLVGTGRGGGGTGDGIGLGDVGLIGWGGGGGDGRQYGRGPGLSYGRNKGIAHADRTSRRPVARVAKGTFSGSGLDKEVIRRIVRSHINEVRHCYNQGLTRDPNLAGRVSIQFQIGGTGRVTAAVPTQQGTTLDDKTVQRCIAKAVQRWKFPRSTTGGASMVSYPFVFSPG